MEFRWNLKADELCSHHRLAAAMPKPRQHMIRFHGIFAPNAKHRADLKSLVPPPEQKLALPLQNEAPDPPQDTTAPPYRRRWAELLQRIFDHDVLKCPRCKGRMKIVQFVDDPLVITKICTHLGLPTSLPLVAPARAPPLGDQLDFEPA